MKRGRWIIPLMLLSSVLLLVLVLFEPSEKGRMQDERAYPRRIITLSSGMTETVFALGAGSRVVGVSSWSSYPSEVGFLPRCGDVLAPNFDRILALKPDLLLVPANAEEIVRFAAQNRIPIVTCDVENLLSVLSNTLQIGLEVGRTSDAVALVDRIRRDMEHVHQSIPEEDRPRVALVLARNVGPVEDVTIAAKGSYLDQLLGFTGGRNAFADREGYEIVSKAEMREANPDVIVEIRRGQYISAEQKSLLSREWADLPSVEAVRQGRIEFLTQDYILIPGPRVGLAGYALLRAVHGDAYLLETQTAQD